MDHPILTVSEASRQDLRWRRAVGGSSAGLAVPPEMDHPILTVSEANRQDLRRRRAVGGSSADLAVPPEMLTMRFAHRSMDCPMGGQQA
jgi:hypothetical protein